MLAARASGARLWALRMAVGQLEALQAGSAWQYGSMVEV